MSVGSNARGPVTGVPPMDQVSEVGRAGHPGESELPARADRR